MKRRPRRVVLLLLLLVAGGAIVNVAVAWGLASKVQMTNERFASFLRSHPDDPSWYFIPFREFGETRLLASTLPFADVGWSHSPQEVPSWSMVRDRPIAPENPFDISSRFWLEVANGWPRLSMAGRVELGQDFDTVGESQWAIPIRGAKQLVLDGRIVPLRPIWPGFAINTVFYAALLWLLFAAPFALRRRRRIKRGLCPKCAYDLRGGSAAEVVCPECGTNC